MEQKIKDRIIGGCFVLFVVVNIVGFIKLFQMAERRPVSVNLIDRPVFNFIVMIYLAAFIMFLVQIAIHELGHVIFGKLTGYEFLSYRFMSFGICKKDRKYRMFRLNVPGTAGQACMLPPKVQDGNDKPYFWYNAGGVFINLITAYLSFGIAMITDNSIVYVCCIMSAIMGFIIAITNGIPYSKKGITDGCNILKCYRYPDQRDALYTQLITLGELSRGKTWMEFEPEEFETTVPADAAFGVILRLYKMNVYNARREFGQAVEILDELILYKKQVSKILEVLITFEQLFQELIGKNDPDQVDELYTKEVQKFLKALQHESSSWRIKMAYEWFHNEDEVEAMVCYEKMKKIREKTMCPGDTETDIMLGDYIKERMEQTDVLQKNQNQVLL